jgi:hypothetical protein
VYFLHRLNNILQRYKDATSGVHVSFCFGSNAQLSSRETEHLFLPVFNIYLSPCPLVEGKAETAVDNQVKLSGESIYHKKNTKQNFLREEHLINLKTLCDPYLGLGLPMRSNKKPPHLVTMHCKKKVSDFPVPRRDVTYQTLPGRE